MEENLEVKLSHLINTFIYYVIRVIYNKISFNKLVLLGGNDIE